MLINCGFVIALEEGDGRCVCASWPHSIKRSILNLLLNPLVFRFHKNFRIDKGYSWCIKRSPFLPTP